MIAAAVGLALRHWRWLAGAALAAGAIVLYQVQLAKARDEGRSEVRAEWQSARLADEELASEVERLRNTANGRVTDAYVQAKNRAIERAAAARGDLDRVLGQLADLEAAGRNAGASSGADAQRIAVLAGLLAESAHLVEEGGRRVEDLDARVTGLQSFVSRVCLTRE